MSALAQVTPQSNVTNSPDLLTVAETAKILRVSEDTVIRWFANRDDVHIFGSREDVRRRKRQYRILRIPRATLHKFLIEHS